MNELPASPLAANLLWTWILPTLVFVAAAGATWRLYLHFAKKK